MKKSILLVTLFLMAISTSFAQKRYLSQAEIPSEITAYIDDFFPNHQIIKAKEKKDFLKTEFKIKLNPKAEVEFDENFNPIEIESKTGIPLSVLPAPVQDFVNTHHKGIGVKEWELKKGGQKLKLLNGLKLYFDSAGKF